MCKIQLNPKSFKQNNVSYLPEAEPSTHNNMKLIVKINQWPNFTKMGYQSTAKFYYNGESVNGQMLLKWGISQLPNFTKMRNQSVAKFY